MKLFKLFTKNIKKRIKTIAAGNQMRVRTAHYFSRSPVAGRPDGS